MDNIWGRLTIDALKHGPIESGAGIGIAVSSFIITFLLFYYRGWRWLWKEWLTSLDPKKIGVMYIFVAALMLFKGLVDASMIRAEQMLSVGSSHGYLTLPIFRKYFLRMGQP